MNWGRIFAGGLVAGLVLNVGQFVLNGVLLEEEWNAALEELGLPAMGGGAIAVLVALTFATGIALVWLYAGLRSRFGPGPKTAIVAGLFVWLMLSLWPYVWNLVTPIFPSNPMTIAAIWSLFELPIGALVGAWIYKETPTVMVG
jgi:hypothetical protein